jgi:hypothetical protein
MTHGSADLPLWTAVTVVTALYLLIRHWRDDTGSGLLVAYVLSFLALHALAPALYLLPWYWTPKLTLSVEGLRVSALGLVAFAIGGEIVALVLARKRRTDGSDQRSPWAVIDPRIITMCLVGGALMYAVLLPIAGVIPSVTAIASTGSTLAVIGLALRCWNGWQRGRRSIVRFWMGMSTLLPLVTVITQGFLGYGFAAMLIVYTFVAGFFRFRWKDVAFGVLFAYLGLSVYVTYMRDRRDIREIVWLNGGLSDRVDQVMATLATAEWFDPQNVEHLARIDKRLNQDYLVGAAVVHLRDQSVGFANGATLVDAAVGLVPRALWPDKPTTAGSGDLVSTYTGFKFAEGTSVGIGQVMEFYVNFGTLGVIAGFFVIGVVVVTADRQARRALARGDVHRFTLWFLPALSFLQVGGSLVEILSTAAAGVVCALLLRFAARHLAAPGLIAGAALPPVQPVDQEALR